MRKFSVIIPVYNNPDELRKSIKAILQQTVPLDTLEILVVDDGSSFDMKTVAQEFSSLVDVKYFYQEDKGFRPGTARNMGINAAIGELCVFADCGVIMSTSCLEEYWNVYQSHGKNSVILGYVYGNDKYSDPKEMRQIIDGHPVDKAIELMEQKKMIDGREVLYSKYGDDIDMWPAPWLALWSLHFCVPTDFLRSNQILFDEYFDTWGCEDNDFGIQLQNSGGRYVIGRGIKAIHYPPETRSVEKLRKDPKFKENFINNQAYVAAKYPDNYAVELWTKVDFVRVNEILLQEKKH